MIRNPILVSTQWLVDHLGDPELRIFDCTGCIQGGQNLGREKHYLKHHIPGAAYLDVANPRGELTDAAAPLGFTWPTPEQFEQAMGRLGVDNECRVILYTGPNPEGPGNGLTWATRAWWLMHHYGVDCAILDGGWAKWQAEGRPVTEQPTEYPATTFRSAPDWQRGLAGKGDVLETIGGSQTCLLDSLSSHSYRGEGDPDYGTFGPRKGHITGALNLEFELVADPATGTFLPVEQLRERFEQAGVDLTKPVITYCGGGIGATATGFALKLLGKEDVRLYDGSLSEWTNDPALPMTDLSQAR
jgi:thiosulfate/3-mercaptopyruvate sulfurtransferase